MTTVCWCGRTAIGQCSRCGAATCQRHGTDTEYLYCSSCSADVRRESIERHSAFVEEQERLWQQEIQEARRAIDEFLTRMRARGNPGARRFFLYHYEEDFQ